MPKEAKDKKGIKKKWKNDRERKEKPHWNEVSECYSIFSLWTSQALGLFGSSNFQPRWQYLSPKYQLYDKWQICS